MRAAGGFASFLFLGARALRFDDSANRFAKFHRANRFQKVGRAGTDVYEEAHLYGGVAVQLN